MIFFNIFESPINIHSVDYVLPVQIGRHFVGVVFRDGDSVMALMDGYDIINKAVLCNPSFDKQHLKCFRNPYDRLLVVRDDEMNEMENVPKLMMSASQPLRRMKPIVSVPLISMPSVSQQVPHLAQQPIIQHEEKEKEMENVPTFTPINSSETPPKISTSYSLPMFGRAPSNSFGSISMASNTQSPLTPISDAAPSQRSEWVLLGDLEEWTNGVVESAFRDKDHFDDILLKNAHFDQMRKH